MVQVPLDVLKEKFAIITEPSKRSTRRSINLINSQITTQENIYQDIMITIYQINVSWTVDAEQGRPNAGRNGKDRNKVDANYLLFLFCFVIVYH